MANEPNYSSNPSKDEPKKEKVRVIPLEYIDEFPGHPFKVLDDESMQKLMNSIVAHGLLHVDEIKHPHFISLCFQQLSGITQDFSLWVKHHKAGIALHDIRLGIKSRFARTRTADYNSALALATAVCALQ